MPARKTTKARTKRRAAAKPKDRRKHGGKPRRVTVTRDAAGEFRYRVQGFNWKIIESSEQGFKRKSTALKRIAEKYPKVELVDLTA